VYPGNPGAGERVAHPVRATSRRRSIPAASDPVPATSRAPECDGVPAAKATSQSGRSCIGQRNPAPDQTASKVRRMPGSDSAAEPAIPATPARTVAGVVPVRAPANASPIAAAGRSGRVEHGLAGPPYP
jgi:hypothetical protein